MRPETIAKLGCVMVDVINDLEIEKTDWLEAKGMPLKEREQQALRAGMLDGWHACINYIQLHGLK